MLNQIIFSHTGLSVGEIETINNLFLKNNFHVTENKIPDDLHSAGILELELPVSRDNDFFDFISIETWTFLIDIIKNIKKRRGKKNLKLKLTFDYYTHDLKSNELFFFKKIIFFLNQQAEIDFNKGLERIEIAIENISEILKRGIPDITKLGDKILRETNDNNKRCIDNDDDIILSIFIFDRMKRAWKNI